MKGLEAGADDFLTKPVNDTALVTRVKSLVRLKLLSDELTLRANQGGTGLDLPLGYAELTDAAPPRVLLVDDRRSSYERIAMTLATEATVELETSGAQEQEAMDALLALMNDKFGEGE